MKKTATSMTADWVCSGQHEAARERSSHRGPMETGLTGKIHFPGAMQMGRRLQAGRVDQRMTSVYKGPDCGSVKPMEKSPEIENSSISEISG